MRRKKYETQQDIEKQESVARAAETAWKAKLIRLPESYIADYGALGEDGRLLGMVEVKCRDVSFGAYPDILVSLSKWMALNDYERSAGLSGVLLYQFNDGIYFHRIGSHPCPDMRIGGRTVQRRDFEDVEPVVHIPNSQWKKL